MKSIFDLRKGSLKWLGEVFFSVGFITRLCRVLGYFSRVQQTFRIRANTYKMCKIHIMICLIKRIFAYALSPYFLKGILLTKQFIEVNTISAIVFAKCAEILLLPFFIAELLYKLVCVQTNHNHTNDVNSKTKERQHTA